MRVEEVLEHCEVALGLLEDERDTLKWNVHWVGAIALIRMVGHALLQEKERFGEKLPRAWADWNSENSEHRVFREFIKLERDTLLKEAQSSIHPSGIIPLITQDLFIRFTKDETGNIDQLEILEENIFRPRLDGFMAGEDARGIYRQALNWWRAQLSKLET
ncbi:MAG: hypothetical protein ABIS39_07250 [Sphingomicrobium sp.]